MRNINSKLKTRTRTEIALWAVNTFDLPLTPSDRQLTRREQEVALLVAEGLTNEEVGRRLYIATGTVKCHIANILQKLEVPNRIGIALWAQHQSTYAENKS